MLESPTLPPARDRRVRRSRAALMSATVRLVAERGTADVPISDLAEAADVSRRLVYQQFRDRDTLLLEAALDLARRELLPQVTEGPGDGHARALAVARHMAAHRAFYRALLTSSCGFALSRALNSLFLPINRRLVRMMYGDRLDDRLLEDLAMLLTGGWGDVVHTWVVDGPAPLDADEFTDRLMRTASALLAPHQKGAADDD
ncbi:helix-turn-helix domain-containing protein [Actinophytocola sp.]|uniref:TetR/AcrR family transcriptional regulator n=1 Tax=Actinophytocola sp. TaxID=1872138 RepID=UPI002ED2AB1F